MDSVAGVWSTSTTGIGPGGARYPEARTIAEGEGPSGLCLGEMYLLGFSRETGVTGRDLE
jgi:hypothetical protein